MDVKLYLQDNVWMRKYPRGRDRCVFYDTLVQRKYYFRVETIPKTQFHFLNQRTHNIFLIIFQMEVIRVLSKQLCGKRSFLSIKGNSLLFKENPRVLRVHGADEHASLLVLKVLPAKINLNCQELLHISNIFPIFLNTVVKRMRTKTNQKDNY